LCVCVLKILKFVYFSQLLACSINASCLALMDSGLAMKFLFAAVTCGVTQDDLLIVDPDANKLKVILSTMQLRDVILIHAIFVGLQGNFNVCI
jgi:ribonuclease PH